jgi:hypothetical protein
MRIATGITATLLSIAVVTGATEVGLRGFNFFVFRGGGVGSTGGSETDQQFLAQEHHTAKPAVKQAPAKQTAAKSGVAPKGRHHKTARQGAETRKK